MIVKIPKDRVVVPESHKKLLSKRKKGRTPRSYYREVSSRRLKLTVPEYIWVKCLKNNFSYELIPSSYLAIMNKDEDTPVVFTDGSISLKVIKKTSVSKVIVLDIYRSLLTEKESTKRGIEWIPQTHILYLDRQNHFLKRLHRRGFDLTPIVDAYIELKRVLPGDSVSVSDGITKILGRKLTGNTVVLNTGMTIGDMDWEDFVDKKL